MPPVKLGQGVVFRPGIAHDERWAPNQFLSGFVTSISGDDASIVVFPDVYAPFYEMRVKRDDALSEDRTWTPSVGEDQEMPEAPSDGQIYGRRNQAWTPISGEDQGYLQAIIISDYPPPSALVGMAWLDSTINNFYIFEQGHWVEPAHMNPSEEIATNVVPPFISGIVAVDQELTCSTGDWTSQPITYAYQWYWGAVAIPSATTNKHTLTVSDVGNVLVCTVIATNSLGVSQAAISNNIYVTAPSVVETPSISGQVGVGEQLLVSTGSWSSSSSPILLTHQWMRSGTPIVGETTHLHIIVAEDVGYDLICAVTATNLIGAITVDSNSISVDAPGNLTAPVVSGSMVLNGLLTSTAGVWDTNQTSTYQWMRNGVSVVGETANTYTLILDDSNVPVLCRVTATNLLGSTSADSNSVTILLPQTLSSPFVAGEALVGAILNCTPGSWLNDPDTFTYQWVRDATAIPGATTSGYQVVTADKTHVIKCLVTATNEFGSVPALSNGIGIP